MSKFRDFMLESSKSLDAIYSAMDKGNKKFDQDLWNWFEDNLSDKNIYAGDATPEDYLDVMTDKEVEKCYKELIKRHKSVLTEEKTKVITEANQLKISLEDGTLIVNVNEESDESHKLTLSYNGTTCSYVAHNGGSVSKSSGNSAEILNHIIQQLFIDGVVKSK